MEPAYPSVYPSDNDEVSLRDVLLKLREYVAELRRNWLILAMFTLPLVLYFGYKSFTKPVSYKAELTFMLNDEQGGSGMASLLGQFGGLLGSGGSDYQLEKILEIARSRRIMSSALFESYALNGQQDFFANHVIRAQDLHQKWGKDSLLNGFLFTKNDPGQFSRRENKALLAVYGEMVGGEGVATPLFSTNLDDDTGIMSLSISSNDEMLSIGLLDSLYKNISTFYIEKSIQRESETFEILAQKRDSIARVLNSNDYASASFDEKSRGLLQETQKIPATRYRRNTQILSLMYGEALKNAEFAEFALKNSTPFLSLIDVPIPPLKPSPKGRAKALVLGLMIGLVLGSVFIIARKIVREALR